MTQRPLLLRPDEPGTPLIVRGLVRSIDGKPLAGAELDTWQCADTGIYSMLGADDQPDWNLRGRGLRESRPSGSTC